LESEELVVPDEWSRSERPAFTELSSCYAMATKSPIMPRGRGSFDDEYDPRRREYTIDVPKAQAKEAEAILLEQQADALAAMLHSREKNEPESKVLQGYRLALGDLRRSAQEARAAVDVLLLKVPAVEQKASTWSTASGGSSPFTLSPRSCCDNRDPEDTSYEVLAVERPQTARWTWGWKGIGRTVLAFCRRSARIPRAALGAPA